MMKKVAAAALLILLLAGLGGWYFGYYKKTPLYSLGLIQEAVASRDQKAFQKHVDLNGILSHGVDDLLVLAVRAREEQPFQQEMAQGILEAVKPAIISGLRENILAGIEKGSLFGEGNAPEDSFRAGEIARQAGLQQITFKGVSYTKQEGESAAAGLKINEPDLGDYDLELRLKRLADGTWQVTEVANLREYLAALAEARLAARRQYLSRIQPILAQYEDELKAIRAASLTVTPELVAKMIANRQALAEALQKEAVPAAAQDIAALRQEYNDAMIEYLRGIEKNIKGDESLALLGQIRDANDKVTTLGASLERLEKSIRADGGK